MNKPKVITTFLLSLCVYPLLAQNAEAASTAFSSTNVILALVAMAQIIAIVAVVTYIRRVSERTDVFIKMRKLKEADKLKPLVLLAIFVGGSTVAMAQGESGSSSMDPNTLLLVILNFVLLLVFAYVVRMLFKTVSWLMPPKTEEQKIAEAKAAKKQTTFTQVLTDAVPVEREAEIMLDHEYDGIRELDNNLPPWWLWMFYATIIYAFVYLIYYHVLPYGESQEEEYLSELRAAEMEKEAYMATAKDLIDENSVEYLGDLADIKAGKAIYDANCMACHAPDGGGGVGPNLTDEYWLHGGGIKDIFRVVKYGVPTKGMIAWESQLSPLQMAQVSSYIKDLVGTVPAAPKDPQGELWRPENSPEIAPDSLEKPEPLTPAPEKDKIEDATALR